MVIDLRHDPAYGHLVDIVRHFQEVIGQRNDIDSSLVRPTNGATGALSALFNAVSVSSYSQGKKPIAVVAIPEYFDALKMFGLYGFDLHKVDGQVANYPFEEVVKSLKHIMPSLFYLSLPNNPSGQLLPVEQLEALLSAASPKTTAVIDRTLVHPDEYCAIPDIQRKHPNKDIVVIDSFSKSHGLVADRVGYAIATKPATAQQIHLYAHVPSTSALTKAIDLIDDQTMLREVIERESRSNDLLQQWSRGKTNLRYYPSSSGFSLIELYRVSSEKCGEGLDSVGYLVRSGSQLYLPDRFVRIDMSQPEVLPGFLKALDSIVTI